MNQEVETLASEVTVCTEAFQLCLAVSHSEECHRIPLPGVVFKDRGFGKVNRWTVCAFPVADCTLTRDLHRDLWELANPPRLISGQALAFRSNLFPLFYFVSSSVSGAETEQYLPSAGCTRFAEWTTFDL